MSSYRVTIFFGLLLLLVFSVKGQNSFEVTFPDLTNNFSLSKVTTGINGDISLIFPNQSYLDVYMLNSLGNNLGGRRVFLEDSKKILRANSPVKQVERKILASISSGVDSQNGCAALLAIDLDQGTSWGIQTSPHIVSFFPPYFSVLNSQKVITGLRLYSDETLNNLAFAHVDFYTGKVEDKYTLKEKGGSDKDYRIYGIGEYSDNSFVASFRRDASRNNKFQYGLVKISSSGEVIDNVILNRDSIEFLANEEFGIDQEGNLYIAAKIRTNSKSEGVIIKFNRNFELVWARKLNIDKFSLSSLKLKVFPAQGEVIFSCYTFLDLPVITGKVNSDGNLLWHKGYAIFSPDIVINFDSSILFLSKKKYYVNGSAEFTPVLYKTTPDGTLDNCPQYDACLSLTDIDIPTVKWEWEKETVSGLDTLAFTIETIDFEIEDHCGTPRPPTPYFVTPDTICQNECLRPDSLYNHLAHAAEWTITGNDVLFENSDTSFTYCFSQPGKYQIEQEVWLLGCSEFFTREVVVLPDSLGDLLGDYQLICEDTLAVLSVEATRPIRDFRWNDGSDSNSLTILESGNYAVTVSDGFCTESDAVEITFFNEKYNGTILEVPTDSSVCEQLLPIIITPQSDFSNAFFLNGNADGRSSFQINRADSYQISTKIEECEFSKTFNLSLEPCEVDIYIPSSFSPNNDGINDLLEPLGKDFMGQKLQVFDRWGGLLFETKEAPFAWNGNEAEEGVYVVTFSYLNLKNQQKEAVSADVLVVR